MRNVSVVAAILMSLLALTACGGGGGGSAGTVLSGVASKGIIRGGAVKVYALNADGSKGSLLKETTTADNGAYRADLGSYRGVALVEVSGAYTDEATGAGNAVPANAPLRAALGVGSGTVAVAVTPLTELAVQLGEDPATGKLAVADLASNNAAIAAAFQVDILGNQPADALAVSATATGKQKEHALVLAAFAQLMRREGKDLHTVIAELKSSLGPDKKLAAATAVQFQAALVEFATGSANRTGIKDISATSLISIGGRTRTLTLAVGGNGTPIGVLDALLILPPGVTVKAVDGVVSGSALQAAGAAAGTALATGYYTPASPSQRGRVKVGLLSDKGCAAGNLLTLQCDIAPDANPGAVDFVLSLLEAYDVNKAPLSGLSLSATLGL